jgi:hypothetical protein
MHDLYLLSDIKEYCKVPSYSVDENSWFVHFTVTLSKYIVPVTSCSILIDKPVRSVLLEKRVNVVELTSKLLNLITFKSASPLIPVLEINEELDMEI